VQSRDPVVGERSTGMSGPPTSLDEPNRTPNPRPRAAPRAGRRRPAASRRTRGARRPRRTTRPRSPARRPSSGRSRPTPTTPSPSRGRDRNHPQAPRRYARAPRRHRDAEGHRTTTARRHSAGCPPSRALPRSRHRGPCRLGKSGRQGREAPVLVAPPTAFRAPRCAGGARRARGRDTRAAPRRARAAACVQRPARACERRAVRRRPSFRTPARAPRASRRCPARSPTAARSPPPARRPPTNEPRRRCRAAQSRTAPVLPPAVGRAPTRVARPAPAGHSSARSHRRERGLRLPSPSQAHSSLSAMLEAICKLRRSVVIPSTHQTYRSRLARHLRVECGTVPAARLAYERALPPAWRRAPSGKAKSRSGDERAEGRVVCAPQSSAH
jgi:hypothetical protein